jgi:hypothetical protein
MRTQLQVNQAVQLRSPVDKISLGGVVVSYGSEGIGVWFPQLTALPAGFVPEGRVQFRYCDYAGVHTAITTLVKVQTGPRCGALLRLPQRFETKQKRKFFRQACSLPTVLSVLSLPQPAENGEEDASAIIEDLSAGGARVRTRMRLVEGDQVQFAIVRPEAEATPPPDLRSSQEMAAIPLKNAFPARPLFVKTEAPAGIGVRARVLRVRQDTFGDAPTFTLGVEFMGVGVGDQDRLVAFVFDLQRSQTRSGPKTSG